jgi:hypothetical protein
VSQPPYDDDPTRNEDSLTWAESFVIPDDISSLEEDIARWRQEQRQKSRRRRPGDLLRHGIRRPNVTAPLLVSTVLIVALLASAMVFFGSRPIQPASPARRPLASSTVQPGSVGGLLPATNVTRQDGSVIDLRSIRPAVLALVPPNCACQPVIAHLSATAVPYGVRLYAVGPDNATLTALQHTASPPPGLLDGGALRALYGGEDGKPTIVVVAADGTVRAIEVGASTDTALNRYLDAAVGGSVLTAS